MTSLALAIAVKGEWDAGRLLQGLRNAGIDSATKIHVACDPEQAINEVAAAATIRIAAHEETILIKPQ